MLGRPHACVRRLDGRWGQDTPDLVQTPGERVDQRFQSLLGDGAGPDVEQSRAAAPDLLTELPARPQQT
ncbi:MAG TPA: hypothetical protein VM487_22955 [Phycisphaerae bacterium]|nr:hypothetical protein [Phycisphaerae bacterium]